MQTRLFIVAIVVGLAAATSIEYLPIGLKKQNDLKNEINSVDTSLEQERTKLKNLRSTIYNTDEFVRPVPHTADEINALTHHMKKLRKNMLKAQEVPSGSTPQEMMLFQQLLSGIKRTSRKKDAAPAMHTASPQQLNAIQSLTDQINEVSNTLESPEQNALHQHAHAQSRLLHRMNHVLDAMGDELDSEKKRNYEEMMTTLMHQHLSDPDYHDSLYDHLLAHHLVATRHRDHEFNDHLTHHLLYHDLDSHIGHDFDVNDGLGAVLSNPLAQKESLAQTANFASLTAAAKQAGSRNTKASSQLNSLLSQRSNNKFAVAPQVRKN